MEGYLATAAAILTVPKLGVEDAIEGTQRVQQALSEGKASLGQDAGGSNRLGNVDGRFPIEDDAGGGVKGRPIVRGEGACHGRVE